MSDASERKKSDRLQAVQSIGSSTDKLRIHNLEDCIDDHEQRIHALEVDIAHGQTTFAEIKKDIHSMTKSLIAVESVLSRLNWTIVLAVIAAVLSLVIKKGLS